MEHTASAVCRISRDSRRNLFRPEKGFESRAGFVNVGLGVWSYQWLNTTHPTTTARYFHAVAGALLFFVSFLRTITALFDNFVLGPSPEVPKLDAYTFSLCLRSTYLLPSDNLLVCCLVLVTFCRSMCRNRFVKDTFKVDRASWTHSHTASTFSIRTFVF